MRKSLIYAFLFLPFCCVSAQTFDIKFTPETPIQGEPLKITILGVKNTEEIKYLSFDSKELTAIKQDSSVFGVVGIDLNKKPGTYKTYLELKNGKKITKDIFIAERKKYTAPLDIPNKLGGNTAQGVTNVVSNLTKENTLLASLEVSKKPKWKKSFNFPVKDPFITDPYGYLRDTVSVNITHKGTDFRAPTGTKVFAVNDGVVSLTKKLTVYGNSVVIDHGAGVESLYMHLSNINVKEGDKIKRGDLVGLSGSTGYAEAPHLHLSIRINKISIDPAKFLSLFGK